MADNKKYYYLKLKDNFYDSESMIILESMQDGYLYSNILMKLYLRSLKDGGKLMFNNMIPYTPSVLAKVVRHQVGTVEKALDIFQKLGLIEILDNGAIYMLDIQNFIGESSTEADRKRQYRTRINAEKDLLLLDKRQMSGQTGDKSTPEIEIKIEKDIEIEKEINKRDKFKEIVNEYTNNTELKEAISEFIKMRKSIKKPLTENALKRIFNKLDQLSNDESIKIKILQQSVDYCWQGVFELQESKHNNQKRDGFNDFKEIWEEIQDDKRGNN